MNKKHNAYILLIFTVLSVQISTTAQEFHKYYHKSGKLIQKISGSATGTQTLYWDDYGNKEYQSVDMTLDMMGMTQKSTETYLTNGLDTYHWNNQSPDVYHTKESLTEEFKNRNYTADDYARLSSKMLEKNGFSKKAEKETVSGKDCDVWEMTGQAVTRIWGWKNLTLKMEMNVMGMSINYEPQSLELNITVPASIFEVPSGKNVVEETQPDEKKQAEKEEMLEIMNNMSKTGDN